MAERTGLESVRWLNLASYVLYKAHSPVQIVPELDKNGFKCTQKVHTKILIQLSDCFLFTQ